MSELMREQRLQIMLTGHELRAIDDWRFTRRMPTRAAAVRELLKRGLAAEGFDTALAGERSQDFGVVKNTDGANSGGPAE
jgi:predicted nucleotidyltransferase